MALVAGWLPERVVVVHIPCVLTDHLYTVKVLRIRYTVRPAAVPADACHGPPRAWHAAPLHSCHTWGALRLLLAWVAM